MKTEQVTNMGIIIDIEGNAQSVAALQITDFNCGPEVVDLIQKQYLQKGNGGITATAIGKYASVAVYAQQPYISSAAKDRAAQLALNPRSVNLPPWKLPKKNANYVGREDLFVALDEQFSSMLGEATSYFGIFGLSGVGKTEAAVEYAHRVYKKTLKNTP